MLYIKKQVSSFYSSFYLYKDEITSDSKSISKCIQIKKSFEGHTILWISVDCTVLYELYGGYLKQLGKTSVYYLNNDRFLVDCFSPHPLITHKDVCQQNNEFKSILLYLQEILLCHYGNKYNIFMDCITTILLM